MPKPNPYRPFEPDPEFMQLWPEGISGNAINGLGETEVRRPDVVWWTTGKEDIAFGEMQKWFYQHEPKIDKLMALRQERRAIIEAPLPQIAEKPAQRTPQEWTAQLDQFMERGVAEQVGVTSLRPQWVYAHHRTAFKQVILLAVQHQYDELKTAPTLQAGIEVTYQYCRAAEAAKQVAGWLREQGWDAEPVTGPMVGKILMIPHAIEAGFGELGKHGSMINAKFGSAFRLGAVLTDAPFAETGRHSFGVDDFCMNCRVCEEACPPAAISADKQQVRGETKWYVDFDKCIPFFAETSGCAICIAVCPWSRPGVSENLISKLARRAERKNQQEAE